MLALDARGGHRGPRGTFLKVRGASNFSLVFTVFGFALFAALLLRLDPAAIGERLHDAGWAVFPAFVLFVLNLCASTMAWRETVEPGDHARRVAFFPLLGAFWSGHAIDGVGVVTTGEVVKGALLARRVPAEESAAALVIYGFINAAVTVAATAIGPAIALFAFDLPADVVGSIFAVSALLVAGVFGLRCMLHRGAADSVVGLLERLPFARGVDLERFEERARLVDRRFQEFRTRHPAAFLRAVAWCSVAKVLQVCEAWILICAVLPDRSAAWLFVVALVSRSATLLIGWFAAFVPGRIGVAEGGAAALFDLLGIGAGAGLSFAILRRVRRVLVIFVGLVVSAGVAVRDRAWRTT